MHVRAEEVSTKSFLSSLVTASRVSIPFESLAAAGLETVFIRQRALHITKCVRVTMFASFGIRSMVSIPPPARVDACQTTVSVLVLDGLQFVLDDIQHALLLRQDVHEIGDRGQQLIVVGLDLIPLHPRQLVETEFEDLVDLGVGEDVAIPLDARLAADQNPESSAVAVLNCVGFQTHRELRRDSDCRG
jgi:hypothetical protein